MGHSKRVASPSLSPVLTSISATGTSLETYASCAIRTIDVAWCVERKILVVAFLNWKQKYLLHLPYYWHFTIYFVGRCLLRNDLPAQNAPLCLPECQPFCDPLTSSPLLRIRSEWVTSWEWLTRLLCWAISGRQRNSVSLLWSQEAPTRNSPRTRIPSFAPSLSPTSSSSSVNRHSIYLMCPLGLHFNFSDERSVIWVCNSFMFPWFTHVSTLPCL